MEIHQLSSGFGYGDAISNHALGLRSLLRSWGYTSEIYARWVEPQVAHECKHIRDFTVREDSVIIYHYSIGGDEVSSRFLQSPGKRVLIYHNITPHHFFASYSNSQYQLTQKGRELLGEFSDKVDLALGDSAYNCAELAERGFRRPRVLPLLIDFQKLDDTLPCPLTLKRYQDDWTNILFVGRIVPNKRQDDLIRAFAAYNGAIDRRSRLFLVGHWLGMENYLMELRELALALGVQDHVVFAGQVDLCQLVAYYQLADVFLCMSEHEGFCVPLLEALHYGIPVLAYAATAVPETLYDAGILFSRKEFALIPELAHLLVTDQGLKERVVARQRQRLSTFEPKAIARQFKPYIDELIAT